MYTYNLFPLLIPIGLSTIIDGAYQGFFCKKNLYLLSLESEYTIYSKLRRQSNPLTCHYYNPGTEGVQYSGQPLGKVPYPTAAQADFSGGCCKIQTGTSSFRVTFPDSDLTN